MALCSPAVRADGGAPQIAYVAGAGSGVSAIDIAQRRVTRTLTLAGEPHSVLLSLDGHALYVTQPALGQVSVLNAKTGATICTAKLPGQPSFMALSLDATILYVGGPGDTSVRALDPSTCRIERTFQTHEPVYGLAVAASTAANATPLTPNQIWITGSTHLTVFDANGNQLGTVPIASGPQNISIPAGFTAYVTTRQGSLVAVDLNTRRVFRTLLIGGQFGTMDYDANTGQVYVPDQKHNQLDVLVPVTIGTTPMPQEPARVFHLNSAPQSVAITSDGQLGFVALANGQVLMLDVPGRSVVTSIAVGGTPHFIITGLYPPATTSTPPAPQQTTISSSLSLLLLAALIVLAVVLLLVTLWLLWRLSRKRTADQKPGHKAANEQDR
ncbi:MAG TPA: YncE family protein [Ktedonobacteraceae bacterium]|nr:YncE family protein [Ktedonobacteraceae bacterium]